MTDETQQIEIMIMLDILDETAKAISKDSGEEKSFSKGDLSKTRMKAQAYTGMASKLIGSFNYEPANKAMSIVNTGVQVASSIARGIAGGPMGWIMLAIEVLSKAISSILGMIRKNNEELNKIDDARRQYGSMDLTGYDVSKDWLGRYKYKKRTK